VIAPPGHRPVAVDPDVLARRLANRRVLLCLDYDGTLVPIAARPHLALFDAAGQRLLRRLARHLPVAVVSGRSLASLRRLVAVPGLVYVGNHGLEISGPRMRFEMPVPPGWRRDLHRLLALIKRDAPRGSAFEHKGVTASVHYRLVAAPDRRRWLPGLRARLRAEVTRGRLRVVRGKAVVELRPPVDWHKGAAVSWLLSRPALAGRTPVYLGDDTTDEDAFLAVRRNGVGVLVGRPRRSAARYRFSGPAEVRALLSCWLQALAGRGAVRARAL
jgi:trehalose-phosphatase